MWVRIPPAAYSRRRADNPPPVDAAGRMEIVRELCSFEGRLTGTDAERRAANRLAERLRALGRRAEVEPTYVHPQSALVHAAHCLIAFAGSLVAISSPGVGFALVLFAATSMYLDLNYRIYLLRSLFFRRGSQNVVSPGPNPSARARLVICAHVDAARSGAIYAPRRRAARPVSPSARPCPSAPFESSSGRWRCCCRCWGREWQGSTPTRSRSSSSSPRSSCSSPSSRWSRSSSPRSAPGRTTTPRASRRRSRSRPSSTPTRPRTSTCGWCSTAARNASRRGCAASSAPTARSSTANAPSSSPSSRSAAATCALRPAPAGS